MGVRVANRDLFFVGKAREKEGKMGFIKRHLEALKRVDLVYIINPDGYVGESVILEIGEALALDKPIIFSNATNSVDLDCLARKFIPIKRCEELKAI